MLLQNIAYFWNNLYNMHWKVQDNLLKKTKMWSILGYVILKRKHFFFNGFWRFKINLVVLEILYLKLCYVQN